MSTKELLHTNNHADTARQKPWIRVLSALGGGRTPAALFDQGLVSAANFLTNVLLARAFGVRDYGVFALAWIAVLFANSLQYALIVTPMMSVGPKQDPAERSAYYSSVLVQQITFSLLAAAVMFVGVRLSVRFHPEWRVSSLALPISGATLAYLLQDFLRRYFFCSGQSKRALITDIVSYLTQIPIIFWLARKQIIAVPGALWIIAGTSFLSFITCIVWYERLTIHAPTMSAVLRRHWHIARWLTPTAFMQWGAGNLFLLAAPVYYGAAASATLRAANNIVGVAHVWFLGLDNVVPAEAAHRVRVAGVDGMLTYIKKIVLQWGGVTLAFTSIIASFPVFWLRLTYGAKYSSDGTVLRLYALLYLIIFTASPLRAALQALEYTAPIFWAYPALIAFSVALAGPFARTLGLNGVILGMCATQIIFQSFIGIALLLRVRKLHRQASLQNVKL
jgi:O-antigen/teichoic acid export membrane protein